MNPFEPLPIKKTLAPADQGELATHVREAHDANTPLYPVGGGTSLSFGLPAKELGNALSLAKLNRVIDYPARDMTVTVEAGLPMKALAELLAKERQWLPIDVPQAEKATIGGVIATNWNGPRRYGEGLIRDHVIGISAIDGTGMPFKGGGRVVKNVAGYDFCKLLCGSLGTLGVITQVTLKVKPIPEQSILVGCRIYSAEQAERLLTQLGRSEARPACIELLAGPEWAAEPALAALDGAQQDKQFLVIGLEGTAAEIEYMISQLAADWRQMDEQPPLVLGEGAAVWRKLIEFPASGESPLALKASLAPSGVAPFIAAAQTLDPECSIQSHAGNGIVIVKLSKFPAQGLSRALVGHLQPAAAAHHGNLVVLSNPSGAEMTHQSAWGGIDVPFWLMTEVKRRFDPKDILNRGRFVFV